MTHIAVVALVPGQSGFYDDLSGIRLSLENTEAKISSGVNTVGLINAVKAGKITVVSGSLGSEAFVSQDATEAMPTYYRLLEKKKKKQIRAQIVNIPMTSELVKEEKIEQKIEVEVEVAEQVTEEAVVEEITETKKKTTKKKKEEVKED